MTTRILTGNPNYRYYTTSKYVKKEGKTAIMLSAGITTRNIKTVTRQEQRKTHWETIQKTKTKINSYDKTEATILKPKRLIIITL